MSVQLILTIRDNQSPLAAIFQHPKCPFSILKEKIESKLSEGKNQRYFTWRLKRPSLEAAWSSSFNLDGLLNLKERHCSSIQSFDDCSQKLWWKQLASDSFVPLPWWKLLIFISSTSSASCPSTFAWTKEERYFVDADIYLSSSQLIAKQSFPLLSLLHIKRNVSICQKKDYVKTFETFFRFYCREQLTSARWLKCVISMASMFSMLSTLAKVEWPFEASYLFGAWIPAQKFLCLVSALYNVHYTVYLSN